MKKSFIKNLLKGIAGLSAVFALVSGCAMSEPEDYSQYAVQSVAGNISNYSTTLSGYSAAEGMTITFKAIDFEGDWDSVIAQTKSARIMAPNLGWWPNGSFYGNIWPSGSQSYGLINGAEYDCMLNGTYDVEVDIDDVIGIRFYVNDTLCVYYSVDDYISLDNRSALVSPETVTIKTLVDTFFEEIKTSVTFGLFYAGGEMENLSVKPGVREIEKEIDITQVSTYPYSYNDELSSKFFAFKNLSADTGVTISFDASNFLNSAGEADSSADWDCIPVKTKNVRLMSPNLGYWPDGLWEANKWPSASNLKNGAAFSCMLGLTSDKKVSIAIDSTNGVRYYVNDTLCVQYEPSETIGSITVSTFINKFFEDCSSLVTLGSYENGSTGVMSNLSVKTGVPDATNQIDPVIDEDSYVITDTALTYNEDANLTNITLPEFDVSTSDIFTLSFNATFATTQKDWTAAIVTTGDNYIVTVPNLDPWNNTATGSALIGKNAYPGATGSYLTNGYAYNSAFTGEKVAITVSFNKTDKSIIYTLNGKAWVVYTSAVWDGDIEEFISAISASLKAGTLKFNANSLAYSDLVITKGRASGATAKELALASSSVTDTIDNWKTSLQAVSGCLLYSDGSADKITLASTEITLSYKDSSSTTVAESAITVGTYTVTATYGSVTANVALTVNSNISEVAATWSGSVTGGDWWTVFAGSSSYDGIKVDTLKKLTTTMQITAVGSGNHEAAPDVILYKSDNTEYGVLRADNYGWKYSVNTNTGLSDLGWVLSSDWDWDNFVSWIEGSTLTLSIINNGDGTAEVHYDFEKNGTTHYQYFSGITVDSDDLYANLVFENCSVTFQ